MRAALPTCLAPPAVAIARWDAAAVLVVVLFALRGSSRGLVAGCVRTAGFVAAILLASRIDAAMGAMLLRLGWVSKDAAGATGWATVVALVVIGSTLLASLLRAVVHESPLGPIDRAGGAAFGALFGAGLCAVAVLAWAGARPRAEVRAALRGSATAVVVDAALRVAGPALPDRLRDRWLEATGPSPR